MVLIDFVIEYTIPKGEFERDDSMLKDLESQWTMYVDGASNANGSGEGLILINPEWEDIQYTLSFGFSSTNNQAKYEALIAALQ